MEVSVDQASSQNTEILHSSFEVKINKNSIDTLIGELQDKQNSGALNDFRNEQISKEVSMLRRFKELPDSINLDSDKPIEIFGSNGSGKSSLADAIGLAIRAEAEVQQQRNYAKMFDKKPRFTDTKGWLDEELQSSWGTAVDLHKGFLPDLLKANIFSVDGFDGSKARVDFINVQDILGGRMYDAMDSQLMSGNSRLEEDSHSSRQAVEERLHNWTGHTEGKPQIIILDEPDFALSPGRQKEFFDGFLKRCKDKGIILVMATNSGYLWDTRQESDSQVIEIKTDIKDEEISTKRFSELMSQLPTEIVEGKTSSLNLKIDKEKIDVLISDLENGKKVFGEVSSEKQNELIQMLKNIGGMGENITFSSGVNLLFGENGSGKSTFAKAVQLAFMVDERGISVDEAARWEHNYGYSVAKVLIKSGILGVASSHGIKADKQDFRHESMVVIDPLVEIGANTRVINKGIMDPREGKEYRKDLEEGKISFAPSGSSRETIEKQIVDKIRWIKPGGMIIIDEAEGGLSPKDQERFHHLLTELGKRGYVVLVPTNSYYAYKNSRPEEKRFYLGNKNA